MAIALVPPSAGPPPQTHGNLYNAQHLRVRHPGYPDGQNQLLSFVPTDGDSDNGQLGVQYGMVHTICAVVAGNRFDGWLSVSRQHSAPGVTVLWENILPTGTYYFHLPAHPGVPAQLADFTLAPYPIVPNFREWSFPHDADAIPSPWRDAPIAAMTNPKPTRERDETCRVTNYGEQTESAHIVPAVEVPWFAQNEMNQYCSYTESKRGEASVDSDDNMICLKEDIHSLWDRMRFSLLPKKEDGRWKWVVHCHTASPELLALYHNLQLQELKGVRFQLLFARFAWDLFPSLQTFLTARVNRRLLLRTGVRDTPASECREFCQGQGNNRSSPARRSKSDSPKRKRDETTDADISSRDVVQCDALSFDSGFGRAHSKSCRCSSFSDEEEAGTEEDTSDSIEQESEDDQHGFQRRHIQARLEARLADSDPHGFKRRRRLVEEYVDYDHDPERRGRKRTRLYSSR